MNIQRLIVEVNKKMAEAELILRNVDEPSEKLRVAGYIAGLQELPNIINEVNKSASETGPGYNKCIGFGSRLRNCNEKVPKLFLRLYCDKCMVVRKEYYDNLKGESNATTSATICSGDGPADII